ncbi:MAG: hypothetical protein U1F67_25510 [Rubrivivax sp.]
MKRSIGEKLAESKYRRAATLRPRAPCAARPAAAICDTQCSAASIIPASREPRRAALPAAS